MRDFFLIKHHPWGLTEAYQKNSRRTRAPRPTHYQPSQGAMTTRTLYPCQAVSIGRVRSAAHSNKEPSYTATLGTPNNVSTNASLLAAMPPPQ